MSKESTFTYATYVEAVGGRPKKRPRYAYNEYVAVVEGNETSGSGEEQKNKK